MHYFVLLVLLTACLGIAHSQEELSDPEKPKPHSVKQETKAEHCGTKESPIFIKGEVTTQKDKQETDSDAEDRQQKSSIDKALVKYTGFSALFAFLLSVFAAVQIALFVWQLKLIRKSLDVAKESADAALETAKSITASERAYVFVNVKIVDDIISTPSGNAQSRFKANFCNHGKTPAIIISLRCYCDLVGVIPNELPKSLGSDERLSEGLVIASELIFEVTIPHGISDSAMGEIERGEKILICYGHIKYTDILKNVRETGYCWEYRPNQGRFVFSGSSGLNHYT